MYCIDYVDAPLGEWHVLNPVGRWHKTFRVEGQAEAYIALKNAGK